MCGRAVKYLYADTALLEKSCLNCGTIIVSYLFHDHSRHEQLYPKVSTCSNPMLPGHVILQIFMCVEHRFQMFEKIPFTRNKMCATLFQEMSIQQVKVEALPWSYNHTLGIFNAINDTPSVARI